VQIGVAAAAVLLLIVAIAAGGKGDREDPPADGGGDARAVLPGPTPAAGKELKVLFVVPSTGLFWQDYGPVKARLEKSGVTVTTLSGRGGRATLFPQPDNPAASVPVNGRLTDETDVGPFAAVVFCGKDTQEYASVPGPAQRAAKRLIQTARREGKLLAAICLGEVPLAEHGALDGKEVAYNETVAGKYGKNGEFTWKYNRSVLRDDLVLTASGPEDNLRFADALLEAIRPK
jgi:putative intracellular protease/amidase